MMPDDGNDHPVAEVEDQEVGEPEASPAPEPPTPPTPEEAAAALRAYSDQRIYACQSELAGLLKRYGCHLEIRPVVVADR